MQEKNKNVLILFDYVSPECTFKRLGKDDVVSTSNIYLPLQPFNEDSAEYYYNNPGIDAK